MAGAHWSSRQKYAEFGMGRLKSRGGAADSTLREMLGFTGAKTEDAHWQSQDECGVIGRASWLL